ncbi:heparinase II/III family protein [Paenibacillus guangzhouensis]|uniref:heparinase II/III family protein n=1 Tax=Paenibacillus guangzhouensis TaxID=1473112 RepID=UPI001267077A|nr:alginate lyase family protein [Paenibacillus guangzhouensis]
MSTLMQKVRKLRGMPIQAAVKMIAGKAARETKHVYRRYRIQWAPLTLQPEAFRAFRSTSRFLFDPQDRERYVKFLRHSGREVEIIHDADRICAHRFDLLGSGERYIGASLPWHEDFKAGYRFPSSFYKHLKIVDLDNAADVKIPWELSRCQHFFTLGKAYWLTQDETYTLEFQAEIEDWIRQNPVEMSVNWTCTMDVAIRAVNWIAAVYFFQDSPLLSESFWNQLNASLYRHGLFIMTNLENEGEHTGNHYLSNLAGLVALGLYFGDFVFDTKESSWNHPRNWLEYGCREMEREMFVQVNPDGSNYEASTSYHRLVAELFLIPTIWCARNGVTFTKEYEARLAKMHDFMYQIMKPDGLTPLIGDADDGRLLIVSRYGSWVRDDFRHLLAVAGEFFDRDDFRDAGRFEQEDAMWIAGGVKSNDEARVPLQSVSFPDGGYYVLRNSNDYCLIRCGDLSFHGHGAHSHNDQLSFVLHVAGQNLIVDPGSYVYTADYRIRNVFRSTKVHNTVQADGYEQNDFDERNLFLMREQSFARCEDFRTDYFAGSHQGYVQKCGVIHRRAFFLREAELEIVDTFEQTEDAGRSMPHLVASYMLSPEAEVERCDEEIRLRICGQAFVVLFDGAESIELQDQGVSRRYGMQVPSRLLRVKGKEAMLRTIIRWG